MRGSAALKAIALVGSVLAAAALLVGCGKPEPKDGQTLTFSILSAENQASMQPLWQPLLDDMQSETGLKIKPFFATNYASLIEAMRFNQVQLGWYSALPALEAVQRAHGQVLGRVLDAGGATAVYRSVLIVRKGSGITLDKVLKCGKRYNFGIGDPNSTSGTLAPMAYLFGPRGIQPAECFKTVRSASHQANVFAVAQGLVDVATNNTVGVVFAQRENPALAAKLQVIWTSPDLPESAIVVRKDLDPAAKEKIRAFFLSYGSAPGAEGERQRQVLAKLTYGGFQAVDAHYLDPVRRMQAAQALSEARASRDKGKIASAEKAFNALPPDRSPAPSTSAGG
jgi:phosphonate transport system substrate-binding protein